MSFERWQIRMCSGAVCRMKKIILVTAAVLASLLPPVGQDAGSLARQPRWGAVSLAPLRLVQTIPLTVEGRLDHLYADVKGMRLFVAALGNNSVEVIDLRAGKRISDLTGIQKPQGVWYVPALEKLFIASGNDGMCRVYYGKTLKLIDSIKLDLGVDLVGYNPRSKLLYVGYGGEDAKKDFGNVAMIDVRRDKHVGDIRTSAHPGSILVDGAGRRIYITIPKTSEVAVIDAKSNQIIKSWQVSEAQRTVTLALDSVNGRLFVGARTPGHVIVYDIASFNKVADFPSVGLMDGMFFDAGRRRLYVSGGEGFVDVFQQRDPNHYDSLAKIPTGPIARTSLFVPELNRYYVAVPRNGDHGAEIRVYEPQ
jgi:DNA-binding beta-propeller fold protein YncE